MIEVLRLEMRDQHLYTLWEIAALIGGLFLLYVHRRNAYRMAAIKFRESFAESLSALRNSNTCPFDILNPAFCAHEIAVHEFSRFLVFNRKAFLRAWRQYAYHERQPNYPFLEQYSSKGQSIGEGQRRQTLAIDRLEQLLSYAGHA